MLIFIWCCDSTSCFYLKTSLMDSRYLQELPILGYSSYTQREKKRKMSLVKYINVDLWLDEKPWPNQRQYFSVYLQESKSCENTDVLNIPVEDWRRHSKTSAVYYFSCVQSVLLRNLNCILKRSKLSLNHILIKVTQHIPPNLEKVLENSEETCTELVV